jgi:hypothetical protein
VDAAFLADARSHGDPILPPVPLDRGADMYVVSALVAGYTAIFAADRLTTPRATDPT